LLKNGAKLISGETTVQ